MIKDKEIVHCIEKRILRLQQYMQENNINYALIYKPENVFYFSHFNPVLNSMPVFVVIPATGSPTLLVPALRYAHAVEEGAISDVLCFGKWGSAPSAANNYVEALKYKIPWKTQKIAFELDSLEVSKYTTFQRELGFVSAVSISEAISSLKIIKDEYEISCIRKAACLVDRGMDVAISALRSGYSEADACTEGQYAMRKLWQASFGSMEICGFGTTEGGMTDSLQMWCLSDTRIAYGCDCSRSYIPREGDVVLPMAWAKVDGYHAENERTLAWGQITGVRAKAYDAVLAARNAEFEILRPGITFADLYNAAVTEFKKAGFRDILPGRVGHGVGNSAHEYPSVAADNLLPLKPGMVITVEPGLMDASWGGVRHSDTVLILSDGYERLTKYPNGFLRNE